MHLSAQGQSLDECFISSRVLTSSIRAGDSISSRQARVFLILRMFFGIQSCFGCYGMKSPIEKKNHLRALCPHSGMCWQRKNYTVPVVGFCIFTVFFMQRDGTKINGCRWLTQDFRKQTECTQCVAHLTLQMVPGQQVLLKPFKRIACKTGSEIKAAKVISVSQFKKHQQPQLISKDL